MLTLVSQNARQALGIVNGLPFTLKWLLEMAKTKFRGWRRVWRAQTDEATHKLLAKNRHKTNMLGRRQLVRIYGIKPAWNANMIPIETPYATRGSRDLQRGIWARPQRPPGR
ncbi:hypothetical protein BOTBODRAFT_254494 [Botryobasidium botryosum FD-172 SS1]|uniref:Uncharacterized protein n=1 Tax=Botryobasidium botryosum (strain FD-172 SS1) TaxID=930990 RepID=A0A067LVW1_BOTB1|nr:hypothetical protein BOTBODRAFT_254494 [Botryobasidium botryosum FD-172 SS1]